jgi:hypothetical protein
MNNKGYGNIPSALSEYITFLVQVLPIRSIPTFIELLVGAMLTQSGFVTDAWLTISPLRTWTAYYKWLQEGKWSWVALGVQLARLVVTFFPQPIWFLIFDDTLIYRCSKKAPGSTVYHQHGNKANRPQYALGQCWVSMALSISTGMKHYAVPLLSRLMRSGGNSSKLDAVKTLLRVIAPVFIGLEVIILVDSWYMKWPLIEYVLASGLNAIGQVRRDTALFGIPSYVNSKRGRPRKYGDKYTPDVIDAIIEYREWVYLYSEWQWVRYRSALCLAKFMGGRKVRAVWMQFEGKDGKLSKQRLIISTKSDLTAQQIFAYYGKRWSIEDLFNQMKNRWGWREAWQQSRQVLHRWTQILSISYALPQLLATYCTDQIQELITLTPWRKKNQVTAGRVRLGLRNILCNVRIRDWWSPKCRKFEVPIAPIPIPSKQCVTRYQLYMLSKNNFVGNFPPPS